MYKYANGEDTIAPFKMTLAPQVGECLEFGVKQSQQNASLHD